MSDVNLKDMLKVVESTPFDQPVLITGYHGIGKSQSITNYFTEKNYHVITLFVGQMADAGDLIGLPDRVDVEYKLTDPEGKEYTEKSKITDFCPPKWWPFDVNSKVVIIFDEVNRGKPEVMQCLMDMILNRKLNGRELPKDTRIVGAMNPLEDGYYQVEELDPAFLDRWNIYNLRPSIEEWIYWGVDNKIHKNILGFISKYQQHLDPPKPNEAEIGNVYPSRRSWEKVSDYILLNSSEAGDMTDERLFEKYLKGVVGIAACADYFQYMKTEIKMNINVGTMLMKWDDNIKKTIESLDVSQILHINVQVVHWLNDKIEDIKDQPKILNPIAYNLGNYLNTIVPEFMAQFFDFLATDFNDGKIWPQIIMENNSKISNRYIDILNAVDID